MSKMKIVAYFIMTAFILAPAAVYAADKTAWDMAESNQYGEKAMGMLGRGLINVATCPVDTIVHTAEGTKEGPAVIGTLGGLGSGLGCTILRALSGVTDVVTSWVPGFNGAPVSQSYSDCLDFGKGQNATGYSEPQPNYGAPDSQMRAPEPVAPKHNAMDYVKK